MPIYEYRCDSCGHELEAIQKLSEDPLVTCPVCKQDALTKKISAAGFRLKGGGWYETDFKSGKKKNVAGEDGAGKGSAKGESPDASKSAKSSEGKSSEGKSCDAKSSSTKSGGSSASN